MWEHHAYNRYAWVNKGLLTFFAIYPLFSLYSFCKLLLVLMLNWRKYFLKMENWCANITFNYQSKQKLFYYVSFILSSSINMMLRKHCMLLKKEKKLDTPHIIDLLVNKRQYIFTFFLFYIFFFFALNHFFLF